MTKNIVIGVLVATTLLFGFLAFGPHVLGAASGPAHYQKESFLQGLAAGVRDTFSLDNAGNLTTTGTFKLGASGTAQANEITTSCNPIANASIAATTTGYAYCTGVTGVVSTDNVVADFATSTVGMTMKADNWVIVSAKASTTPGAIDFLLLNLTGTAAVPSSVGRMASTTTIHASH